MTRGSPLRQPCDEAVKCLNRETQTEDAKKPAAKTNAAGRRRSERPRMPEGVGAYLGLGSLDLINVQGNLGDLMAVDVQQDRVGPDAADVQLIEDDREIERDGGRRLGNDGLENGFAKDAQCLLASVDDGGLERVLPGVPLIAAQTHRQRALRDESRSLLDIDAVEGADDGHFSSVRGSKITKGKNFGFHQAKACGRRGKERQTKIRGKCIAPKLS